MLVITRKCGEVIVIGDGIEIEVLRVGADSVRLGVTADPSVRVYRREIYEQVKAANRDAAAAPSHQAVQLAQRLRRQTEGSDPPSGRQT